MRAGLVTAALLGPLLAFLALTLILPLGLTFWQSVSDPDVRRALPRTVGVLENWRPPAPVPPAAYAALLSDLAVLPGPEAAVAARRLNIETPGLRTLFMAAANGGIAADVPDPRAALIAVRAGWGEPAIWRAIRAARGPFTARFLLAALDVEEKPDGSLGTRGGDRAIYKEVYARTFLVAAVATALCLALGLPLALYLAALDPDRARLMLLIIMLPLWTSVLVRAMAWILILGSNGLVNALLLVTGLVGHPLTLVFNRFGVLVTMAHVLLPFMVLPLTQALRRVPRSQLWAAASLGASPWTVLRRVYLPQARPGLAAGCILVFASAAGYYITPALVGGGSDQMLGAFVQTAALRNGDEQLAAALGVVFLMIFLAVVGGFAVLLRPRRLTSRGLANV